MFNKYIGPILGETMLNSVDHYLISKTKKKHVHSTFDLILSNIKVVKYLMSSPNYSVNKDDIDVEVKLAAEELCQTIAHLNEYLTSKVLYGDERFVVHTVDTNKYITRESLAGGIVLYTVPLIVRNINSDSDGDYEFYELDFRVLVNLSDQVVKLLDE